MINYLIVSQHTVYGQTKRFITDLDRALTIYRNHQASRWNTSTELFCRLSDNTPWLPMVDTEPTQREEAGRIGRIEFQSAGATRQK